MLLCSVIFITVLSFQMTYTKKTGESLLHGNQISSYLTFHRLLVFKEFLAFHITKLIQLTDHLFCSWVSRSLYPDQG